MQSGLIIIHKLKMKNCRKCPRIQGAKFSKNMNPDHQQLLKHKYNSQIGIIVGMYGLYILLWFASWPIMFLIAYIIIVYY